jgi:hypothetical protein
MELGVVPMDLGCRQPLPAALIDLPQAWISIYRQAVKAGDLNGGVRGARKIARINGANRLLPQGLRQESSLLPADGIERHVGLTLVAAVVVPISSSVSAQDERCH